MQPPIHPVLPPFVPEFVKNHCPKVLEARDWRKRYDAEGTEEDDVGYAECAFHKAVFGRECEACGKFLTRPHTYTRPGSKDLVIHEVDRQFLDKIEHFYDVDMPKFDREWEEYQAALVRYQEYLESIELEAAAGFVKEGAGI